MLYPSTILQILDHAIENLSDESNWLKGLLATDKDGNRVTSYDPRACKFCMVGALINSANRFNRHDLAESGGILRMVIKLSHPGFSGDMAEFNDHTKTTHAGVIQVLTEARNIVRNHLKDVQ